MDGCENKETCPMCQGKTKMRSDEEYKALVNRLSRIEGQVRGLKRMVEENAYCTDIMIQVTAVTAALNAFNRELMTSHIKGCVTEDVRNGNYDTVNDLISTLQKLMK